PRILTQVRSRSRATSGLTTISAPPPSVTTQQSSRCNGSHIIGDASTSSTETLLRSSAWGLYWAWCEAATLTQASCSLVVPNSYMCRIAHIAYWFTTVGPNGYSNWTSGAAEP